VTKNIRHAVAKRIDCRTPDEFLDAAGEACGTVTPVIKQSLSTLQPGQVLLNDAARTSDFERIAVPTLLVHGSGAALLTQRICHRLAHTLPGASTRTIRGAGHMSPLTHRDEVNDLIVAHLDANTVPDCLDGASLVA
jgi:pimeloyl-ACP methyl ester carboxylesterase